MSFKVYLVGGLERSVLSEESEEDCWDWDESEGDRWLDDKLGADGEGEDWTGWGRGTGGGGALLIGVDWNGGVGGGILKVDGARGLEGWRGGARGLEDWRGGGVGLIETCGGLGAGLRAESWSSSGEASRLANSVPELPPMSRRGVMLSGWLLLGVWSLDDSGGEKFCWSDPPIFILSR